MQNWHKKSNFNFFKNLIHAYDINHAVFRKNSSINYVIFDSKTYKIINKTQKKIVDSSGAGDGYNAAYLSEFLKSNNVSKALKSAHILGSKIVMKKGAII